MARQTDIRLRRSAVSGSIPTTSNLNLGELALNTADGKVYMKKSVGGTDTIIEVGSAGGIAASFTAYEYTATANQTTFSGSDNNSTTLAYNTGTPPKVQVFMNGILLDEGSSNDYTATNGTSIVLNSGADAGDLIQIHAYKSDISIVNNLNFNDNQKLQFGDSQDLQIYHDGSNSIISDVGTGHLKLRGANTYLQNADGTANYLVAIQGDETKLYFNNSAKIATTSTGVDVYGNLDASGTVFFNSDLRANNVSNKLIVKATSSTTELHAAGSTGIIFKDSGNGQTASLDNGGNLVLNGLLSAEDNIYLTDAGTARGKLLLNSSDRDNVELRAESIGSTMKFFTAATEALELDASQKASFKGSIVLNSNGKVVEIADAAIQWYSYPDSAYKQAKFRATDYQFKNGGNTPVMTVSSGGNLTTSGVITANGTSGSSFYGITLSRSSSGTTTPDIWGSSGTLVIGTSSSDEVLGMSGTAATFYGTLASGAFTSSGAIVGSSVQSTGNLFGTNGLHTLNTAGNGWDHTINRNGGSPTANLPGGITSGNITTTGYIRGPSTFTIDPAAHGDNTGTLVIAGNLQVDGTTTTINSTTLTVDDKNITLASGSTNKAAANGAGITVDCGSDTDATILYDGTNDEWDFNKNVDVTGTVTADGLTVNSGNTSSNLSIRNGSNNSFLNIYSDLNGVALLDVDGANVGANPRFQIDVGNVQTFRITEGGDIAFYDDTGSNPSLFWDASSEWLGIGTSSPDRQLELEGQGVLRLNATGSNTDPGIDFNTASASDMQIRYRGATDKLAIYSYGTSSDVVTIQKSNGNVGIGTTSPSHKLDVNGTIRAQGAITSTLTSSGGTFLSIGHSGNENWSFDAKSGASSTDYVDFGIAGGTRCMTWQEDGKVGIGTTAPSFPLHINKGTSSYSPTSGVNENVFGINTSGYTDGRQQVTFSRLDGNWIDGTSGTDTSYGWVWNYLNDVRGGLVYDHRGSERMQLFSSYGALGFITPDAADGNGVPTDSNMVERLTILAGGNVGIGTTAPTHKLHTSTSATGVYIQREISANAANLSEFNSHRSLIIKNRTGGSFLMFGGNGSRTDIQATDGAGTPTAKNIALNPFGGNVGIGTTAPGYKLDIGGTTGNTANTLRLHQDNGGTALRIGAGGGSSDVVLWRIDGDSSNSPDNHAGATNLGAYGYSLKYFGTGSGQENRLKLLADDGGSSAQQVVYNVGQNGDINFEQNVSIGTANPTRKFEVHDNGRTFTVGEKSGYSVSYGPIIETNSDAIVMPATVWLDNSNVRLYKTGTSARLHGDGGIEFGVYNGSAAIEAMRIKNDGNVGIGDNSPDNKLTIRAASTIGTVNGHIMLTGDGATVGEGPQIVFSESGNNSDFAGAYIGHARTGGNSVGDLIFGTRATVGDSSTVPTERMRIDSSGNVGVGVQSIPSWANLITNGTVAVGGTLYMKTGNAIQALSAFPGGASDLKMQTGGGKVTIGGPGGSTTGHLELYGRYSGSDPKLSFKSDHPASGNTTVWDMARITADDGGNYNGVLHFQVAAGNGSANNGAALATAMTIQDTKYVGIGTTNPDTNLEVDIKNGADGNGIHITSTSTTNDPTLKLTRNGSADRFQFMIRGGAGSARLGISAGTNLDSGLNLGSNNGLSIGTVTAAGSGGLLVDNDIKSNSRFGVGSGGSLADAAIYKNSDTNTGIYWPGTDQIALTTAGSNRLHIASNGGVSLNSQNQLTTGGNARLSIIDSSVQLSMGASNSDMSYIRKQGAGQFAWQTYNSGNSGILQLQPYGGNVTINTTAAVSGHALSVSGKIGGLTYSDSYVQFTGGNAILKANDDVVIGYTSALYVKQSGKVGVGTSDPKAKFQVDHAGIDAYSVNTSATSAAQVDTFSATDFRSARFTVQITNTTDSTYQITEILLIHDGTTPSMTEYSTIFTGSAREASFDADIVSGNVRLLATPASTDTMQFKVVRHSILV